jgi:O-antigen/teichoic acid export membrane protein
MHKSKRLITNTLINMIQSPLDMIIQVFLTPFIVNTLGKSAYGIWTLTGSTLSYIGELRAGLNSAVSYHVPRLHQQKDVAGINRVVSTVTAFYSVIAILGAFFIALLAWRFPYWFNVPDELRNTCRVVAVIVGCGMEVTVLTSAYSGVLAGLQRYDVMVGAQVGFVISRALGVVLVLSLGIGLIGLASVSVCVETGLATLIVVTAYQLLPGLNVHRSLIDPKILPGLLAYSTSSMMFGSGQLIMSQASKTLVGLLYGPSAVTDFSIPFVLLTMVGGFVLAMTRAVKPMTTMLDAMDESEKVQRLYVLSTKYSLMIAIPGAMTFMLFGDELLRAWMGQNYGGPGGTLLAVMAIPQMLRVSQLAGYYVVTGLGKHRFFGFSILIQAISGIVLAFVLAHVMGFGLMGVAIGVSIPEVIGCGFFIPRYCCKTLGLRVRDQIRRAAVPVVLANLPLLACFVVADRTLVVNSRMMFLGLLSVAGVIWAGSMWFFGLSGDERSIFLALVRRPQGSRG